MNSSLMRCISSEKTVSRTFFRSVLYPRCVAAIERGAFLERKRSCSAMDRWVTGTKLHRRGVLRAISLQAWQMWATRTHSGTPRWWL